MNDHRTFKIEHPTSREGAGTRRGYAMAVAAVALLGFALVLLATRWGIGTSHDSARYVRSARHVLGREAVAPTPIEAPAERAHFPPLYPSVLAAASLGGADPLTAARWLHALLMAANIVVAAELVRRFTGARAAAVFAAGFAAVSPSALFVHAFALSEPLFILLSLLALGLLASHASRPRARFVVVAGVLAGAGVLVRYAGWAMLPAGIAALLLLPRRRWQSRAIDALLFAACCAVLPAAWAVRNAIVLGSATNRDIAFHPVGLPHARDALRVTWEWLVSDAAVRPLLTLPAALLVLGVAVAAPLLAWRRTRDEDAAPAFQLSASLLLFAMAFAGLLVASISLVDFHTPIDRRVLVPVHAAWIVLAACLLGEASRGGRRFRVAAWTFAGALLVVAAGRGGAMVRAYWSDGAGYAHRTWRQSPIIAAARDVPDNRYIYTNVPGAMYLLTRHPVIITVPSEISASSAQPNPTFAQDLARMAGDLRSGRAVLVYVNKGAAARRDYALDGQDFKKRLGLHRMLHRSDGDIYDYVAPATTMAITP